MQIFSSCVDVSYFFKVSEGFLIVKKGGEGIRGGYYIVDVQFNVYNGYQSG